MSAFANVLFYILGTFLDTALILLSHWDWELLLKGRISLFLKVNTSDFPFF
jgi:hypothetical protein